MIEISQTEVLVGTEPDVIVLPEGDYGSLRTEEWSQLFSRLEEEVPPLPERFFFLFCPLSPAHFERKLTPR